MIDSIFNPVLIFRGHCHSIQTDRGSDFIGSLFYLGSGHLTPDDLLPEKCIKILPLDKCFLFSVAPSQFDLIDYTSHILLINRIAEEFKADLMGKLDCILFEEANRLNAVIFKTESDCSETAMSVINTVCRRIQTKYSLPCSSIIIHDPYPFSETFRTMRHMDDAWHYYSFISHKPPILQLDSAFEHPESINSFMQNKIYAIISSIEKGNVEQLEQIILETSRSLTIMSCPYIWKACTQTCLFLNQLEATMVRRGMLNLHVPTTLSEKYSDFLEQSDSEAQLHEFLRNNIIMLRDRILEQKDGFDSRLCRNIADYIAENLSDVNLSLNTVAQNFGASTSKINSKFRKYAGNSIPAFIHIKRVETAKSFLESGRFTVSDVARKVGYVSPSTMYRAFLRYEKISPHNFKGNTSD